MNRVVRVEQRLAEPLRNRNAVGKLNIGKLVVNESMSANDRNFRGWPLWSPFVKDVVPSFGVWPS